MAITILSSSEALDNAKSSAVNAWPNRDNAVNRVEPLCKPAFKASFHLQKTDSVFTIGSCFARNVEAYLESLGFDVPMRRLEVAKNYTGPAETNPNIFNNYAVPSIYNELQWALDKSAPFDPETCLLEVAPNKFCDLHLTRLLKATPLADALARRERIKSAMGRLRDCRVVIVTLGLVEVWYDNLAGRYLNIAPPKMACVKSPGRFELHVMEYDEVVDYLRNTISLIQSAGHPEAQIVLTVSPVPLAITFTKQDVITANCYSKAVLRAAAEKVISEFGKIDYFPSFESVTLSERSLTWSDDLRHVTRDVIRLNVIRMVKAYTSTAESETKVADAKLAEQRRQFAYAASIYEDIIRDDAQDEFVVRYASCLVRDRQFEKARDLLVGLTSAEDVGREATTLLAHALWRLGDHAAFREMVPNLEAIGTREALMEVVIGSFNLGDYARAQDVCLTMRTASPRAPFPYEYLARVALASGRREEAEELMLEALAYNQALPSLFALMGEIQLQLGKATEAQGSFERALILNPRTSAALKGMENLQRSALSANAA